ncbi:MAG TPA: hypothetical protein VHN77_02060 [Phycisphaerales bacterium]|nr:hypothetical protein [Phycisphaerales bacterium]
MPAFRATFLAFTAVALLGAAPLCAETVIYQAPGNAFFAWTTNDWGSVFEPDAATELPGGNEGEAANGQLLTFAGTERAVTRVTIKPLRVFTSGAFSASYTVSIYDVAGTLPGVLLWTGTSPIVPVSNSMAGLDFFPNITVPDTAIVAFSTNSITGPQTTNVIGIAGQAQPPTIGAAPANQYLAMDSATGQWSTIAVQSAGYMGLTVYAVPGPRVLALVGVVPVVVRRRRVIARH